MTDKQQPPTQTLTFKEFVQKVAAVPKDAIEALEAQREKRPPRRRKVKPKAKG